MHVASEGYEQALYERLQMFESDDPSIRIEYWLREGDPATEILSEASAKECDLIALGTHGWTGLDRLLMGSVAQKASAAPTARCSLPGPPRRPHRRAVPGLWQRQFSEC